MSEFVDFVSPQQMLLRFLDTNGDGTGTKDAAADYSVTVDDFFITDANRTMYINTLIIHIRDAGGMGAAEYGNVAALTNGISILCLDSSDNTLLDLTDGEPIKNNASLWRHIQADPIVSFSAGDDVLNVRWPIKDDCGRALRIAPGNKFVVRLNDNFSALTDHYFAVRGWYQ